MKTDEHMHLLDKLQNLLEKQIEMARRGNFRRVEILAEQAGSVVEKIVKINPLGQPEFDDRRRNLLKLYKKLELTLTAGKASVKKQLQHLGNVKKTLKVYHNSV